MRVGLLGFSTHEANKGCEALTYAFIEILKNCVNEKLDVHFFFCGDDLGQLPAQFPDLTFSIENVHFKDWRLSAFRAIGKCDAIFDVTCGDGFSDIYLREQVLTTTRAKLFTEFTRTPLVLLPQTYGPFKDKVIEKMAGKAIIHAAKVYSRDQDSTDYVRKLTGIDAFTATDMAFALPYVKKSLPQTECVRIGINVSGLLWNGGFREKNQFGLAFSYQDYIRKILHVLQKKPQYEVHLIPHVVGNEISCPDDDANICEKLALEYNMIFAGAFKTPIEAKNYIAAMDFFTGARMHSTIAALSAGIPVLPFSYSRKFEGMFSTLDYAWIISAKSMSLEEAIDLTLRSIEQRRELATNVISSMNKVKNKLVCFTEDLNQYINNLR